MIDHHPAVVGDGRVRNDDAFGASGGAGGVDDVGRARAIDGPRPARLALSRSHRARGRAGSFTGIVTPTSGQAEFVRLIDDDGADFGIREDRRQPRIRLTRIERHVDRGGAQDAEHRDDGGGTALQQHRDAIAGLHAPRLPGARPDSRLDLSARDRSASRCPQQVRSHRGGGAPPRRSTPAPYPRFLAMRRRWPKVQGYVRVPRRRACPMPRRACAARLRSPQRELVK